MDIFKPIQIFSDFITYDVFRIIPHSYWGDTINFFIYDVIKIGLLLVVINYVMAIIRYYFPMEKVRDILTKRRWFGLDYLFAAVLGMVTPFCSCSSIPLFIGFMQARVPIGVTFAFLISSPLINEASLYFFPAIFGLNVAIQYNVMGILVAMFGGLIIQRLNLEKYVNRDLLKSQATKNVETNADKKKHSLKILLGYWWADGWIITKQVFPYVVLGVGIGAVIHGFVPENLVTQYLSAKTWWSVPIAVLLGAPLYANSVGILPIMEALANKGMPLGNLLAFMAGITTISIPELIILKKVMRWQLLAAFLTVTLLGAIVMGYYFNMIL